MKARKMQEVEKAKNGVPVSTPSGAAAAAPGHDPSSENGIAERPQTLRYPEIINNFSANYG